MDTSTIIVGYKCRVDTQNAYNGVLGTDMAAF